MLFSYVIRFVPFEECPDLDFAKYVCFLWICFNCGQKNTIIITFLFVNV